MAPKSVLSCRHSEHHLKLLSVQPALSKKNGPMLSLTQNPYQTITRCECVCFLTTNCEFFEPQVQQYC